MSEPTTVQPGRQVQMATIVAVQQEQIAELTQRVTMLSAALREADQVKEAEREMHPPEAAR